MLTVLDLEIHFLTGEPLLLTLDLSRGDVYRPATPGDPIAVELYPDAMTKDVYLVDPAQVRYKRLTERQMDPGPTIPEGSHLTPTGILEWS